MRKVTYRIAWRPTRNDPEISQVTVSTKGQLDDIIRDEVSGAPWHVVEVWQGERLVRVDGCRSAAV